MSAVCCPHCLCASLDEIIMCWEGLAGSFNQFLLQTLLACCTYSGWRCAENILNTVSVRVPAECRAPGITALIQNAL